MLAMNLKGANICYKVDFLIKKYLSPLDTTILS